jgi:hypothetical protein
MSASVRSFLFGPLLNYADKLRFPRLLALTAGLFLVDLVVPDFIPFADEILLALATLVLSRWKKQREPQPLDGEFRPARD